MDIFVEHAEAIATLVSVIVALVIAVIGFAKNQKRLRREFTQTIMLQRLSNPDLAKATQLVGKLVAAKKHYPIEPENDEEDRIFVMLLSYYEFVAIGYYQKDLDRKTVKRQAQKAMKAAFEVAKEYILARRAVLGRDRLYIELEKMVRKF